MSTMMIQWNDTMLTIGAWKLAGSESRRNSVVLATFHCGILRYSGIIPEEAFYYWWPDSGLPKALLFFLLCAMADLFNALVRPACLEQADVFTLKQMKWHFLPFEVRNAIVCIGPIVYLFYGELMTIFYLRYTTTVQHSCWWWWWRAIYSTIVGSCHWYWEVMRWLIFIWRRFFHCYSR